MKNQASGKAAASTSPCLVFPNMFSWKEGPAKTQVMLWRLCFSAGLGIFWNHPGKTGRGSCGRRCLGLHAHAAPLTTQFLNMWQINGWMCFKVWILICIYLIHLSCRGILLSLFGPGASTWLKARWVRALLPLSMSWWERRTTVQKYVPWFCSRGIKHNQCIGWTLNNIQKFQSNVINHQYLNAVGFCCFLSLLAEFCVSLDFLFVQMHYLWPCESQRCLVCPGPAWSPSEAEWPLSLCSHSGISDWRN